MATALGYMAIDQYGQVYKMPGEKHPRKALLAMLGRQHAAKMWVDLKSGGARHIGYVIGRLWLEVYRVCPFHAD